jgi:hypothetical protein
MYFNFQSTQQMQQIIAFHHSGNQLFVVFGNNHSGNQLFVVFAVLTEN